MTIIFTIILFLIGTISIISLYWLKIDMYFLLFKLEKHPMLIAMLEGFRSVGASEIRRAW